MRRKTGFLYVLSVVFGAAQAQAQDLFNPVIPAAPSDAERQVQTSGCSGADPARTESFFGFSLVPEISTYGRFVSAVQPNGPAAGKLESGDLILSVNGTNLVDTPYGGIGEGGDDIRLNDISAEFIDRGIYVYGLRRGAPFQAVIWSCAGPPVPHHFVAKNANGNFYWTMNFLWPERSDGYPVPDVGIEMVVAGLTWAQNNNPNHLSETKHPLAPFGIEYCHRPDILAISYTTTKTTEKSNAYGVIDRQEKVVDQTLHIDRSFYSFYRQNFDTIHNDPKSLAVAISRVLSRTTKEFGCASPEFKDFEQRVYRYFGAEW